MFVCPECARPFGDPGFCTEHGAPLADSRTDPMLGQLVGSHRIARLIGRGGMGEVYLGVHPEISSRVAIKLLAFEAAFSQTLVDRFFAEARAVNVIRHEGIVSVIDLSRLADGRPYIVMEYLDGAPLSGVLETHRPTPLGGFVQIIVSVLDALGAAHAHGITHRDLKPDNVFVTSAGRTKILDFGIAKLRPDIAQLNDQTRTGALLGTPFYMSPEQARGQHVDQRSDLYSMGVILYEGICGQRPFAASNLYDLLRQQIEVAPERPTRLRPELPMALETVVLRALEKDPAHRFQSTQEFAHALIEASRFLDPESFVTLAGRPGHSVPPRIPSPIVYSATLPDRPKQPRRAAWLWLGLGALGAIVLLAATGVGAFLFFASRDTLTITETAPSNRGSDPEPEAPETPAIDLQHVEAVGFLPRARELAREKFADAELQTLTIDEPGKDGKVDFDEGGSIVYAFKSPKAGEGKATGACVVWVSLDGEAPIVSAPPSFSCLLGTVRTPRCSAARVVKMANVHGDGVTLVYGPTPYWTVTDDKHDLPRTFPDDC